MSDARAPKPRPPTPAPIRTAFPPILGEAPRLLILGSMPSEASLAARQYYGHPRNAFWPIVERLLKLPAGSGYGQRAAALREHGIALWDVIAACARPGSLDADIRPETVRVNDFAALFDAHPGIRCIAFNGGTAEREFRRRVLPGLGGAHAAIERLRLPSTSPAHAGMRFEDKLAAWRVILERL
ncbi:MAG: DNA-deoxyinosine glycosylase [Thiohalocapsa sp.]|jgi:hypoxanthine-DNA glycosylase|uniref:DNA-deoxyinosine glycosylase n=1 Tax=Thiohalocapsa sp. TaxID=2497641 RepID=UPI0025F80E24|nr:DNA-deoxyinosine glycosylase [Thiohalocapsa sp.]MCG6939703.1 DNA-deoxyinosine glycosylase [Thiohalocapsa sp.]